MQEFHGTGVGRGIAIGPVVRMAEPIPEPPNDPSRRSAADERDRATSALEWVAGDLRERAGRAGGAARDVLEAQALMTTDPTVADEVGKRVDAGLTAERAVFEAFATFRAMLEAVGGYVGERAADLADVSRRVVARLSGLPVPGVPSPGHPFVLVATDLSPADSATLDPAVLGLVTSAGGPTSHTAIIARAKSIPAVVGAVGVEAVGTGETVIVDAERDLVVASPTAVQVGEARERMSRRAAMLAAPAAAGTLADGAPVPLLANLGSADEAADAVRLGAEGVGLFRTEFLFLDAERPPTVEVQRVEYARLLEAFPGRKVVVRVLDAGADKPLAFLTPDAEPNPALGVRGIRALRRAEPVLRDQLSALAAAADGTDAHLQVMAPMVATVEEAAWFTALAAEFGLVDAGVMVEVPAAALLAEQVLGVAAFASIGTNDLTQYTMAADRLLGAVASLQDPWHPAVLRLVAEVGRAGIVTGRPVGICGEAAADPLLAVVLVGLGATTLSMAPSALAEVRVELAAHTREGAERIARAALSGAGAREARDAARAAADAPE